MDNFLFTIFGLWFVSMAPLYLGSRLIIVNWVKEIRRARVGNTPTPTPLKTILQFFAKVVSPRKQSLNLTVVFSKNIHFVNFAPR